MLSITDPDCPRLPTNNAIMVGETHSATLLQTHTHPHTQSIGLHRTRFSPSLSPPPSQIPRSDGSGSNAFDEVSQIILDMKSSRAINWHTATLLYDQVYGKCTGPAWFVSSATGDMNAFCAYFVFSRRGN